MAAQAISGSSSNGGNGNSKIDDIRARRQELVKEYWWFKPFIWALSITFFLFFIDEGNYDLSWMKSWGNFVVFLIYILVMFPVLVAIRWVYIKLLDLFIRL